MSQQISPQANSAQPGIQREKEPYQIVGSIDDARSPTDSYISFIPDSRLAPEAVDVLVVGGGPAGLACMRKLKEISPSCNAILAEAGHTLGGRVRGALLGDANQVPREGGAEFAYKNLLDELSKIGVSVDENELIPVNPYENEKLCIYDQGRIHDALSFFNGFDPDQISDSIGEEVRAFGSDISIAEFLNHHSPSFQNLRENHPKMAELLWQRLIGEYACQSLDEMGVAVCAAETAADPVEAHYNTLTGDTFRVAGGYSSLIRKLGDGMDIRMGTRIQSIERMEDQQYLVTAKNDRNETVFYAAHQVVLAVPIPVLSHIEMPTGVDCDALIRKCTQNTYGEGHVVKVVFKSTAPLLPEGKEALAITDRPVEVWQRKVSDKDYECTLWIAGPAATEFEERSGMGVKKAAPAGYLASGSSGSHILAREMLSEIFGEACTEFISRMSILPWHRMTNAGHAYRTVLPTGLPFDQLDQAKYVKLAPGLILVGGDANMATVPSAIESGRLGAEEILKNT